MACIILQISAVFAWITFVIQWAFVNFHWVITTRFKSFIVGRLFVCCTLNDIQCFIPRLRYIFSCKPTIKTEIRYFVWMNILSMNIIRFYMWLQMKNFFMFQEMTYMKNMPLAPLSFNIDPILQLHCCQHFCLSSTAPNNVVKPLIIPSFLNSFLSFSAWTSSVL